MYGTAYVPTYHTVLRTYLNINFPIGRVGNIKNTLMSLILHNTLCNQMLYNTHLQHALLPWNSDDVFGTSSVSQTGAEILYMAMLATYPGVHVCNERCIQPCPYFVLGVVSVLDKRRFPLNAIKDVENQLINLHDKL